MLMVAVHLIPIVAQAETAKQSILKQLRGAGATSAATPASVDLHGKEAETALAELLAAGTVREARHKLYYVDESAASASASSSAFVALVVLLVTASITASVIAIAATR